MLVKICFKNGVESKVRADEFVVDADNKCYYIGRHHLCDLTIKFSEIKHIYVV